jgi:hypoxanthine-DNA glycosylase
MRRNLSPVYPSSPISCFPPIADRHARLLILGSMPGKESLRAQQYYAHPRNAFWKIMGDLFGATPELAYKARVTLLKERGIAVWDVLASCTRSSSLDADIDLTSLVVNDFAAFYRIHRHITQIFFNGAMAEKFYAKHVSFAAHPKLHFRRLPSTSPAHAGMPYAQKLQYWRVIAQSCSDVE